MNWPYRSARIFIDDTLGEHVPIDSWRFWLFWERSMRIDDQALINVAFLGHPTEIILDGMTVDDVNGMMHWGGTGFFVTVTSECKRYTYTYIVTAKHVADGLRTKDGFVRINHRNGGLALCRLPGPDRWFYHPDVPDEVDVAILAWAPFLQDLEIRTMDVPDWFLSQDVINARNIGPGDSVFAVGLFSKMTGREKNFPIVRTGHIAMMPDEKIPHIRIGKWSGAAEAYLIESRSIGGWSGSPVFVRPSLHIPFKADNDQQKMPFFGIGGKPYLLGLVHGHWNIPRDTLNDVHLKSLDPMKDDAANLGLTVVIPAHKIREVIDQPKLVEMRREMSERATREGGTVQDYEPDRH